MVRRAFTWEGKLDSVCMAEIEHLQLHCTAVSFVQLYLGAVVLPDRNEFNSFAGRSESVKMVQSAGPLVSFL